VESKYGSSWGGWCSSEHVGAYGVGLLKNIRKGWDLRWKMTQRLDYDIIFGVGIWLLRKLFLFYLALLVQMILLLWLTWNFLEIPFGRT